MLTIRHVFLSPLNIIFLVMALITMVSGLLIQSVAENHRLIVGATTFLPMVLCLMMVETTLLLIDQNECLRNTPKLRQRLTKGCSYSFLVFVVLFILLGGHKNTFSAPLIWFFILCNIIKYTLNLRPYFFEVLKFVAFIGLVQINTPELEGLGLPVFQKNFGEIPPLIGGFVTIALCTAQVFLFSTPRDWRPESRSEDTEDPLFLSQLHPELYANAWWFSLYKNLQPHNLALYAPGLYISSTIFPLTIIMMVFNYATTPEDVTSYLPLVSLLFVFVWSDATCGCLSIGRMRERIAWYQLRPGSGGMKNIFKKFALRILFCVSMVSILVGLLCAYFLWVDNNLSSESLMSLSVLCLSVVLLSLAQFFYTTVMSNKGLLWILPVSLVAIVSMSVLMFSIGRFSSTLHTPIVLIAYCVLALLVSVGYCKWRASRLSVAD